ncbi:molybdopterin-guanine dinucleotide biosynthesis protein B [Leeia sp. TBRC 13508]|uniref:Molybdopterin-guanine dinucleotide biosynthesis protein B n=1 Tax=Leeia speluncae TaxID=2884804 RepID=A0ABS8D8M6_9NEIS|nr:molybdopterin-guanine dinucleotide biosynthesis protein B [Leeia speluncae]MCB6184583.1 molybdopterin-guanine dinucleotide biosynthesis protein B [Leeia speluncae]
MQNIPKNVLGIAGWSGSGKTTLIERLLPLLRERGLMVNVIKHSHHDFVMEPAHKDSARFRTAGAQEVMIASPYRWAIVHELAGNPEPTLKEQLAKLSTVDLVLLEGFKNEQIPKVEVWREANGKPLLAAEDKTIIAVISDTALNQTNATYEWLDLNQPALLADWICAWLKTQP